MTPAQASGRYDFVEDVPIQGPTDPGMRAAACWWTQNVLPVKSPACVDCKGPVPLWAKNPTAWGGGWPQYGGNGGPNCGPSPIRYGSRAVAGFALDAAGDPAATLASDQQTWVISALNNLNTQIGQATGTSCPGWQDAGTSFAAAVGCFQLWANFNRKGSLRTDGVLDQDTLTVLQAVAAAHPADFPTPFPAAAPATLPEPPPVTAATVPPPPPVEKKGRFEFSTGAKIALGVASAIAVGGVVYTATRKRTQ